MIYSIQYTVYVTDGSCTLRNIIEYSGSFWKWTRIRVKICCISHVACKFYSHSCARILTMSDFQDMTITFTFFKILFLLRIYRKICIFYKKYCNSRTIISAFSFRSLNKSYTKIQKSLLFTILKTKLRKIRKSLHYRLSLPFL